MIQVARDYEGLRAAALEFFEDAAFARVREQMLQRAETAVNRDELIAEAAPKRTLADGYYTRVAYLLSLEDMMEAGIVFRASDLRADEVYGLRSVQSAREEFKANFPACPRCGAHNRKYSAACASCGAEFGRKD